MSFPVHHLHTQLVIPFQSVSCQGDAGARDGVVAEQPIVGNDQKIPVRKREKEVEVILGTGKGDRHRLVSGSAGQVPDPPPVFADP